MPTTKTWAGTSYDLPNNREPKGWGQDVAQFLQDIADKALSTGGGAMTLTADLDLGDTYGIIAPYFKSGSATISSTGIVRFANNEGLGWRNAGNSADLILKVDSGNRLEFDGADIPTISSTDTLTNKTLTSPKINENVALTTTATRLNYLTNAAGYTGENGTNLVFGTNATLITPTLQGNTTAASINKVAITAPATGSTLTIADGKTFTASNTLTLTGTDGSSVAFGTGGTVLYSGGALGTPSSGTLTNCTNLPVSTGISGLGTGVATFLATPSSANLASAVSDETGTGSLVFANTPTLVTPNIGAATGSSVTLSMAGTATNTFASSNGVSQVIVQSGASGSGAYTLFKRSSTSYSEIGTDSTKTGLYFATYNPSFGYVGDVTLAGAWTLGPSGSTNTNLTVNGKIAPTDNIVMASGKGIDFSATSNSSGSMSSELLSDYEEGTFTPSLTLSSGSFTMSAQTGRYTKIGRLINVQIFVQYSTYTGTGNIGFSGLPFTVVNSNAGYGGVIRGLTSNFGSSCTGGYVSANGTTGSLTKSNNETSLTNSDIGSAGYICFNVVYETA